MPCVGYGVCRHWQWRAGGAQKVAAGGANATLVRCVGLLVWGSVERLSLCGVVCVGLSARRAGVNCMHAFCVQACGLRSVVVGVLCAIQHGRSRKTLQG
jgi:hypothetical protein